MNFVDLVTPFPVLQTERLTLRHIEPSDSQMLYALFSDERVTRYYGIHTFTTMKQADALHVYFDGLIPQGRGIRWGITQHGSRYLIGTLGFDHLDLHNRTAEIGFELALFRWGNGFMMESLHEVLRFGFEDLGLDQVRAVVHPENAASLRLLARMGFETGEKTVDLPHFTDRILTRRAAR